MGELVNLTSAAVVTRNPAGDEVRIPPSGQVARAGYGRVVGLPPPREGVRYIVSAEAAEAASRVQRSDVVRAGPRAWAVRADGKIVVVTRLEAHDG